jgi:hypothetical protein
MRVPTFPILYFLAREPKRLGVGRFKWKGASFGAIEVEMNTNPSPEILPPAVVEAFELVKPLLEADGRKFILVTFPREEFVRASKRGESYSIDTAASVGRVAAIRVLKDYLIAEKDGSGISNEVTEETTKPE